MGRGLWKVPKVLCSALVNGRLARGAGRMGAVTDENKVESLRGLALVALGFLLHLGIKVAEMWNISGRPGVPTR